MSSILSELTMIAHSAMGLPDDLRVKQCDIAAEVFYSETIFLPALVIITNVLHHRASGEILIEIDGSIDKSINAPFGLILNGDINLKNLSLPLGYIELCIKKTLRLVGLIIKEDQFEMLSQHWTAELLSEFREGDRVSFEQYSQMDIFKGVI